MAEALEDLDRGRLACAVRPQEGKDLPAADLEIDPAYCLIAAVALAQSTDGDDCFIWCVGRLTLGHGDFE